VVALVSRFLGENAMSDALSFAEVYRQHVELLPARTVLSMFLKADDPSTGGEGATDSGAGPISKFLGEAMALAVPKSL
jgi:hypothetical protein